MGNEGRAEQLAAVSAMYGCPGSIAEGIYRYATLDSVLRDLACGIGCGNAATAKIAALLAESDAEVARLRAAVEQSRADAYAEAADALHAEARWQVEMNMRGLGHTTDSVGRLGVVGSIFRSRAALATHRAAAAKSKSV